MGSLLVLGLVGQFCYYLTQVHTHATSGSDSATLLQPSADIAQDEGDRRPKKIALLFIIQRHLPLEVFWNRYLPLDDDESNQIRNNSSRAPYSIYIHSIPEQKNLFLNIPRFKERVIASVPSEWYWNLLDPQLQLLAYALADPDNEKFYFISDSSIPLKPWPQLYREVMSQRGSSFCFYPRNQARDSYFKGTEKLFPDPEHWRKADMWMVLSRAAATFLHYSAIEARGLVNFLRSSSLPAAADESLFISLMLREGMQSDIINYSQVDKENAYHQGDCRPHWFYWAGFMDYPDNPAFSGLSHCILEHEQPRQEWEALSNQAMDSATEESQRQELMARLTQNVCIKWTPFQFLRMSQSNLEEILDSPMWMARKISENATVVLTTTLCGKVGQILPITDFLTCHFALCVCCN